MTNYKKQLGITLNQAKEIAKQKNGRLPRPDYEVTVKTGTTAVYNLATQFTTSRITENEYRIYLANNAGKFYLWQWTSVLPINAPQSDFNQDIRRL